jgi:hypothetical protein
MRMRAHESWRRVIRYLCGDQLQGPRYLTPVAVARLHIGALEEDVLMRGHLAVLRMDSSRYGHQSLLRRVRRDVLSVARGSRGISIRNAARLNLHQKLRLILRRKHWHSAVNRRVVLLWGRHSSHWHRIIAVLSERGVKILCGRMICRPI